MEAYHSPLLLHMSGLVWQQRDALGPATAVARHEGHRLFELFTLRGSKLLEVLHFKSSLCASYTTSHNIIAGSACTGKACATTEFLQP